MSRLNEVSFNETIYTIGSNVVRWFDHKPDEDHALRQMIRSSHEVLASASTVFPFTLFPDTIMLDRSKITIVKRDFILSSETIGIRIEDVLSVTVNVSPFFGSIKILTRVFGQEKPYQINHFKRKDAIRLKHIIQGYLIASRRNIDCANLKHEELVRLLEQLGHDPTAL